MLWWLFRISQHICVDTPPWFATPSCLYELFWFPCRHACSASFGEEGYIGGGYALLFYTAQEWKWRPIQVRDWAFIAKLSYTAGSGVNIRRLIVGVCTIIVSRDKTGRRLEAGLYQICVICILSKRCKGSCQSSAQHVALSHAARREQKIARRSLMWYENAVDHATSSTL